MFHKQISGWREIAHDHEQSRVHEHQTLDILVSEVIFCTNKRTLAKLNFLVKIY